MVHGYEEKENIGARVVSALLTGTDGTVYVGYKNGFGIIPVGEDRITSFYTVKDGLCNDCIDCIVEVYPVSQDIADNNMSSTTIIFLVAINL